MHLPSAVNNEVKTVTEKTTQSFYRNLLSDPVLKDGYLQWIIVFSCNLIFVGFLCSRALASIGMISIIAASVLFKGPLEVFKKYFGAKDLWVLSFFFWIVLLSGIYSEDKNAWLNWVRIKLPFLFLPLAFAVVKRLDERKFILVLYGFVITLTVSAILVLGNYFMHFENITDSFNRGNQIPMPYSHIRYALMLAFAFFCCLYLFGNRQYLYKQKEKWVQLFLAIFIAITLHILSVRSALLAFYLGLFFLALKGIFNQRKITLGIALIILLTSAPFAAYKWVPSFHNKITYMDYDLYEYNHGRINENSDAMRLLSMQIGLDIWKQHPLIGTGAGDIEKEMYKEYAEKYTQISENNRRLPHNQFIWTLMSTGVMGFAIFMAAFFYPFIAGAKYRNWLLAVLYIIIFSSFFTEVTFEEQIGSGFYLIMLLLLMNHLKSE
jgi:O-antigen ligase